MSDAAIAEPAMRTRTTGIMWALRITGTLIVLVVLAQPVSIGMFVTGDVAASMAHGMGAVTTALLTLIHLVLSVLRWKPGGGPAAGIGVSLMFLAIVAVQSTMGMFKLYPLHFLLGVLLAIGAVQLATAAWRDGRSPAKEDNR